MTINRQFSGSKNFSETAKMTENLFGKVLAGFGIVFKVLRYIQPCLLCKATSRIMHDTKGELKDFCFKMW